MSSQVELEAETAKARLTNAGSMETAIASLKDIGFSCTLHADQSKLTGQPSFICRKTITEKAWWGHKSYHTISVSLDADAANQIASSNVRIFWGGLRGL
jgi:hypothetical protein